MPVSSCKARTERERLGELPSMVGGGWMRRHGGRLALPPCLGDARLCERGEGRVAWGSEGPPAEDVAPVGGGRRDRAGGAVVRATDPHPPHRGSGRGQS